MDMIFPHGGTEEEKVCPFSAVFVTGRMFGVWSGGAWWATRAGPDDDWNTKFKNWNNCFMEMGEIVTGLKRKYGDYKAQVGMTVTTRDHDKTLEIMLKEISKPNQINFAGSETEKLCPFCYYHKNYVVAINEGRQSRGQVDL